jgi:hypothetical protein
MASPVDGGHAVRVTVSITQRPPSSDSCLATPGCRPDPIGARRDSGIPEGRVGEHVAAMLAAVPSDDPLRGDLRFLALTHASFKAEVNPNARWSRDNDHAMCARRFAERYTSDERLLTTLELHDEPYWIWRTADAPEQALRPLLDEDADTDLDRRR